MSELKPCPFCGGKAHLDREEIFCDCGAKMSFPLYVWGAAACDGFPTYEQSKEMAIKAWNRRVDIRETAFNR